MNIIKLLSKKKIYSLFFIIFLASFCYIVSNNVITIPSDITPLSDSNYEAMFYIQNTETGTMTCIGDGLVNSPLQISGDYEAVSNTIVSAPDYSNYLSGSLTVKWTKIVNSDDGLQVIGVIAPSDANQTIIAQAEFANIEELKSANLSNGDTATTKGFYTENDGGGAEYHILQSPRIRENKYTTFKLDNGLFAELVFDSDSILNIAALGIMPETKVASDLNTIFNILEHKISGFQFQTGTYYIEEPLYLHSYAYYGNSTTFLVSNDFNAKEINIILTKKTNTEPYDITLSNIDFVIETGTNSSLYNYDSVLVALRYINSCSIDSCNFIARPSASNGAFQSVCVLWFKQTDMIKNVKITNCNVINDTGLNYNGSEKDNLLGGTLLFSGPKDDYYNKFENIQVSDCKLTSTINDETVSLWNGNYNNVSFNNCIIENSNHPSNNLITLYRGEFHNTSFNNCQINVAKPARNVIKYRQLTNASDIIFNGCDIMLNSTDSTPGNNSVCLFKIDDDIVNYSGITTATFNNCNIEATPGTVYGSYFRYNNVDNKDLYINDCEINGEVQLGKAYISNAKNVDINIVNSDGIDDSSIISKNTEQVTININ